MYLKIGWGRNFCSFEKIFRKLKQIKIQSAEKTILVIFEDNMSIYTSCKNYFETTVCCILVAHFLLSLIFQKLQKYSKFWKIFLDSTSIWYGNYFYSTQRISMDRTFSFWHNKTQFSLFYQQKNNSRSQEVVMFSKKFRIETKSKVRTSQNFSQCCATMHFVSKNCYLLVLNTHISFHIR